MSTRRLAAIMFTDIAGYTALMQTDEPRALAIRQRHREVFERLHATHRGQIVQYYGDGTLSVFDSAVDAVSCAVAMQKEFQQEPQVPLRIGLHTGDILITETEVIGDGVNLASRVESMAVPGAVLVSESVFDQIKNQPEFEGKSLGMFTFKNVTKPIEVFAIVNEGLQIPNPKNLSGKFLKRTSADASWFQRMPIWARYVAGLALFLVLAPFIYAPITNLFQAGAATKQITFTNAAGQTITREIIPPEQRREIFIGYFEVAPQDTGLVWATVGLPHAIEVDLDQDPYCYTFSEKQQITTSLSEQLKAANQLDTRYLLRGSLRSVESGLAAKVQLYALPGGTVQDRFEVQANDLLALADSVSWRTKRLVDLPENHLASSPDLPLSETFTRSQEAYAYFGRGLYAALQRDPAFFDLLRQAVATDSTFAWAAFNYANFLNVYQRSERQTRCMVDLALDHVGRMPDLYSVFVRQLNYKVKGQHDKALDLLKLMTQLEPNEHSHWVQLVNEAYVQNQYETCLEAISHARELQDDPSFEQKSEARSLLQLGRAKEGLTVANAYLAQQGDDRDGLMLKGQLLLALDQIDEAEQLFQQGSLLFDDFPFFEQMTKHCAFRREHQVLTEETAQPYVGKFWVDFLTTFRFELKWAAGHLAFQAPNQPQFLFYQTSDSSFTAVQGVAMRVLAREENKVNRLLIFQHQQQTLPVSRLEPEVIALFEAFDDNDMEKANDLMGPAQEAAPEDSFLVIMAQHLSFRLTPTYEAEMTRLTQYVGQYDNPRVSFYFLLQDDKLHFNQGIGRQNMGLDPARLFCFAPAKFFTTATTSTYFDFSEGGNKVTMNYFQMGRSIEAVRPGN